MRIETIKFTVSRKKRIWEVRHNLDEFGMRLIDAFTTWSDRTLEFKKSAFEEYVKSKDPINFKIKVK